MQSSFDLVSQRLKLYCVLSFVQGVLDVLMVQGGTLRENEDIPPAGNLLAYRQSLSEDHTFLKVLGMKDSSLISIMTTTYFILIQSSAVTASKTVNLDKRLVGPYLHVLQV